MVERQLLQRKTSLNAPLIAIDLMGAGEEPRAIAEAVVASGSSCHFVFLTHKSKPVPYSSYEAPDLFTESDNPLQVARRKKTSLTLGIELLKEKKVDALITAGDTGTLIAASRFHLEALLPSRTTALMTKLPTLKGHVLIGDLGAHVNAKAEHFLDFAKLGSALLLAGKHSSCKIALLNIGQEATKGPPEWIKAYQLLKEFAAQKGLTFKGNIEACDLFTQDIDLVITEALAGNILLKTAEGVAKMVMKALKGKSEAPSWLDWSDYPGALLAGISVPIIKVHGYAPAKAFLSAIRSLEGLIANQTISRMKQFL